VTEHIGQEGNGAGSQIWAMVSSPLFNIMCMMVSATIHCTMPLIQKDIVGFIFVDDTNLCILGLAAARNNIAIKMQHLVTNWEGLLCATGGALVLDKCFWYVINQQWDKDQWQNKTVQQGSGDIIVADLARKTTNIPPSNPLRPNKHSEYASLWTGIC